MRSSGVSLTPSRHLVPSGSTSTSGISPVYRPRFNNTGDDCRLGSYIEPAYAGLNRTKVKPRAACRSLFWWWPKQSNGSGIRHDCVRVRIPPYVGRRRVAALLSASSTHEICPRINGIFNFGSDTTDGTLQLRGLRSLLRVPATPISIADRPATDSCYPPPHLRDLIY